MLCFKNDDVALVFIGESTKVFAKSKSQMHGYLIEGYYMRFGSKRYWYHVTTGYSYRVKRASERDYLEDCCGSEPDRQI